MTDSKTVPIFTQKAVLSTWMNFIFFKTFCASIYTRTVLDALRTWGFWQMAKMATQFVILILRVHIVIPSLFNSLCSSSGVVWDHPSFNLYKCSSLGLAKRTPCFFVPVLSISNLIFLWHLWQRKPSKKDIFATCHDWICVLTHHQPRVCIFSYPLLYLAEKRTAHWKKKRLNMTLAKHLCPLFIVVFWGQWVVIWIVELWTTHIDNEAVWHLSIP